ncbi:hypothetical protein LCGC14_0806100 [marine sediment metagenome]|uniref:Uncharacterized protein n=1 Tax=marine sediment metagenome TaxID=412755 RepID=A0A0F9PN58_9ZZZZ
MPVDVKIGSMEHQSLDILKEILVKLFPESDWKNCNYNDLLSFCSNKTWSYLKEHYPEKMFQLLENKLICPESWTKVQKAEFLGIKLGAI